MNESEQEVIYKLRSALDQERHYNHNLRKQYEELEGERHGSTNLWYEVDQLTKQNRALELEKKLIENARERDIQNAVEERDEEIGKLTARIDELLDERDEHLRQIDELNQALMEKP